MRFFLLSQPIDRGHNRLMINEWKPLNPQTNLLHIRQVRSDETMSLCHIGNADRVPCPTPVREKRSNSSIMRIGGKRNVSLLWLASPDKLILESMTTKATDFKQTMISEIGSFIERQARAVSIADINRLIVDLPALRERFAKIPTDTYPNLADQLQLLSLVVEEQVIRDPAGQMVGEAAFALLYFQRATDLIPDSIPGMGLLDDAMIVRIVMGRHRQAFKFNPHGYNLSWPTPGFEVDQLLSVVSPLRLTSFCQSMVIGPPSAERDDPGLPASLAIAPRRRQIAR
jgi:uncharacterized membrane protein YkvA (DUF1232 family)